MLRLPSTALLATGVLAAASLPAHGQLSDFVENFDGLDQNNPNALSDIGFQLFAQGINPDGSLSFQAGPFAAPNNISSPNISVVSSDGAGNQGLTFFTDFTSPLNNPDDPRQDALNLSLFQQQTISAADIGRTVSFSFTFDDAENPPAGNTVAEAFLLTLDPNAGFAATNNLSFDTTSNPETPTPGLLTLELASEALVGQILQFGFRNTVADSEGNAVNFDNIVFLADINNPIPEPASAAVLAAGGLLLARRRRPA